MKWSQHVKLILPYILFGGILWGCQSADQGVVKQATSTARVVRESNKTQGEVTSPVDTWYRARVSYINLEGGFFGLITENGRKYLPLNLDSAFKQDGMVVAIKLQVQRNTRTIFQWGQPIVINDIKLLKQASKNSH